jgi:hypothetical protein
VDDLAGIHIHHAERIVAEFGHEQPAARNVEGHVIDAPRDIAERNFGFELQWRRLRARSRRPGDGKKRNQNKMQHTSSSRSAFCRGRHATPWRA